MVFANFVASCTFLIYGDGIYNYSLGSRRAQSQHPLPSLRWTMHLLVFLTASVVSDTRRTYTAIVTNTMLVSNKVLAYLSCAPAA